MKNLIVSGLLVLSAFPVSGAAADVFDETFEQPTGMTYLFPPPTGTPVVYHGRFSAWSKEGTLSLTYANGAGTSGSGGMVCKVVKPSPYFMFMAQNRVELPIADPATATINQITGYVLSFDANIPSGKKIEVSFSPNFTDPSLKAQAYDSRLVFDRIVGTGAYAHYTFKTSSVGDERSQSFLDFLKAAREKGQKTTSMDIQWTLLGGVQVWAAGDTIQLDNIKLVSAP